MSDKFDLDFIIENRNANKRKRALEKMKISKEGVSDSIKESFPVINKIANHPLMKGESSSAAVLKALDFAHEEITKLRLNLNNLDPNSLPWKKRITFIYNLNIGTAKKGIPSQKNQMKPRKGKTKTGKSYIGFMNSSNTNNFRKDVTHQWGMQHDFSEPKLKHCVLDITVYFPQKSISDLDGKITSILDALKIAKVIEDDDYMRVGFIPRAMYRKNKAGFDIKFYQLDEKDYLNMVGIN